MNEFAALPLARAVFASVTGLAIDGWQATPGPDLPDALLQAGEQRFSIEYKSAASAEQIGEALRRIAGSTAAATVPLVVVPYMGPTGQAMCGAAGVSWFDLSGNADIRTPRLRVRILGRPNAYARPGRPTSLFAPRSARLARVLLQDATRRYAAGELVALTGLSRGYLSRLLPRYEEAGFVERSSAGREVHVQASSPDRLLDAWCAAEDFARHTVLRGHVAARGGEELLTELTTVLAREKTPYAVTGLAAAWLWEPFATFRTVTLYLAEWPTPKLQADLGFHEGARGSNTWLVVPADEGVFSATAELGGVRCVSPVQTYIDLKGQPERADEAAEELRRVRLTWPIATGSTS